MNSPTSTMESGHLIAHPPLIRGDVVMGKLLQDAGKITRQEMEQILELQRKKNLRFGEAAIRLGLVTEADIQQALSFQFGYPYLSDDCEGLSQELVTAINPYSKEAEALRSVRSQLLLRWFHQGRKMLAIGSVVKNEGASYLAANLAVLFAQLGQKTLLIDADMRQPQQHQIFNLGHSKGLSDILAKRAAATIASPIKSFPTLSILPSGSPPPNPAELLMRPDFGDLLKTLVNMYDIVLIDTSPSKNVSDIQTIAGQTGGVLISTRRNKSKLASLRELSEKIVVTGAQLVGAVVLD